MRVWLLSGSLLCVFALSSPVVTAEQSKKQQGSKQEGSKKDQEERFKRWLKEDVVYIISDDEKAVFQKLATPEEKEAFIEQFWQRRNPDPTSSTNEFKEEHYRRIAYANDKFTSGDPGWMTDRGRIYIIHGKPDSIESRPDGGVYNRPIEEGGGTTSVYPYEKWRYRYIEGLGSNIELEFVDKSGTGKYELATSPYDKDALLEIGLGPTLAEQTGLATRADHPALNPAAGGAQYGGVNYFTRRTDTPFARYELAAKVQAPAVVKYPELKELVSVSVKYKMLPVAVEQDCFKLNDDQVLVPISVQIRNDELTFKSDGIFQVARLGIYGVVTSLANRIVTEFEGEVVASFRNEELAAGLKKYSIYQKIVPISRTMRCRLDLVVKDINSGNAGVVRQAITIPPLSNDSLSASSMILSDTVQSLKTIPTGDDMFILGDVKVLPKLDKQYTNEMPLGVYLQVYNAALDASTGAPSLTVNYKLYQDGKLLAIGTDEKGESTQFYSSQRVVITKELSLEGLNPGKYQIQVEVVDHLSNHKTQANGDFSVVSGRPTG